LVGKLVKELASKLMVQEINSFQINYFSLNLFFPLKDHVTTTTERKKKRAMAAVIMHESKN